LAALSDTPLEQGTKFYPRLRPEKVTPEGQQERR